MISKGRVIRTGLFFALANLLITEVIGMFLRYIMLYPVNGFIDRYWIHAHSHTGFLGWIFMVLAIMSYSMFLPKNGNINRRMYRVMIYCQIAVLGMVVTFPIMGYAALSILFSTLHMVIALLFVVIFFRNAVKTDLAAKFIKAGLVFMVISSLGPLALGPIVVTGMRDTLWYNMAIYFYLHFQYNGWFTMAIFGLLFKLLEQLGLFVDEQKVKLFYRLLVYGIIMTLTLSFLGFGPSPYVRIVGILGAVLQLWAGYLLLRILFLKSDLSQLLVNNWLKWFFGMALFSWLLKIMLQFLSVIPVITDFVYLNRDAIMTYLHLSFLGFSTCFIIGLFIFKRHLYITGKVSQLGFLLFLVGVGLMELTIGLRSLPQYLSLEFFSLLNYLLFFESILLFVSVFIMMLFSFILPGRVIKQ